MSEIEEPVRSTLEARPAAAAGPVRARANAGDFAWYMAGFGAYFFAIGVNTVLFQWLLVVVLGERADRIGIAQMAGMLPTLFFVLFGGIAADRTELRGHLIRLQTIGLLPPIALALAILFGGLSYSLMIAIALVGGVIGAFIMPARDSMLSHVAERSSGYDIPRAVQHSLFIQFGAQLFGFALAGLAGDIGALPLLAAIIAASLFSNYSTQRLAPVPPSRAAPAKRRSLAEIVAGTLGDVRAGLVEVWHSPRLRPLVQYMFLMGLFGMGSIMVLMPILVRDVHGGGSMEIAGLSFAFFGGIATTALTLSVRRISLERPGRAMMLSSFGGILALIAIHFSPPLWLLYVFVYLWGLTAGLNMSMSRSIVQELAPPTHRARILSVYSLGFLGAGPLSALLAGILARALGPLDAALVSAGGLTFIFLCMLSFTGLWSLRRLSARPLAPETEPA